MPGWVAATIIAVFVAGTASASNSPLVKLAASRFPNLTHAERALLEYAQAGNVDRGRVAVAGTSSTLEDPSNDPKHAEKWGKEREIRAQLIRWLCDEPTAIQLVSPSGIQVIGARIVGDLNLDGIQPPFGIVLVRCSIPGRISLTDAHLRWLYLSGSCTGQIYAGGLISDNSVFLDGVQSSAELVLDGSKIDGILVLRGAHFRHGPKPLPYMEALASWNLAVRITYVRISGAVDMIQGFEADGAVELDNAVIGGDVTLFGSRFINPNNVAFTANSDVIGGEMMLSWSVGEKYPAQFDGQALFFDDQIAGGFSASHTVFSGAPNTQHGLMVVNTSIRGNMELDGIELPNGGDLNLVGSSAHTYIDDRSGWPQAGRLTLDGFRYDSLSPPFGYVGAPVDVDSRLRWLRLQEGFHIQPYRQLAKVLRDAGDDAGATQVLIAKEDQRFQNSGLLLRIWARFLKVTIGYGHQPFRTIVWMLGVIILGWLLVSAGVRARIMRQTWPDSPPPSEIAAYEKLHPLLYSLDVFLPFVNLHQEHYWWPDAERSGECSILGARLRVSGTFLRYYLWAQVIAGWMLSAIFVAGITGLLRND
jgi:hypothetical protein